MLDAPLTPFELRVVQALRGSKRLRVRVDDAIRDEASIADASISRGRARGGGRSSKAKGRTAVVNVRDLILATFPELGADDVLVKATSMGGCDAHLSPKAQFYFPAAIEVKNVEALNIWGALAQSKVNAHGRPYVVFFKRAQTEMFVALPAPDYLALLRKVNP